MQQTLDFSSWEETPEQKHERIDKILEKNTIADFICVACKEPITGTQKLLSTEHGYYHGAPMTCVEGRSDSDLPWWQR